MGIAELFPDFEQLRNAGFAGLGCRKPVVMVAMTPRTGSTHLCAALEAVGNAGQITEIFNPRGMIAAEKARRGVATFADYVRSFDTQPGEIFCFKTCWFDFAPVADFCRTLFPDLKVIYLNRRDVIAQAVSMHMALLTDRWHEPKSRPAGTPKDVRGDFNAAWVANKVLDLEAEKAAWAEYFIALSIKPMRLDYEVFAADVNVALRTIAVSGVMALRGAVDGNVGYRKLADELNGEWVERAQKHIFGMT